MQTAGRSEELTLWGTPVRTSPAEKKKTEETHEVGMMRDKAMPDTMGAYGASATMSAVRSHTFIIEQRGRETELRGQRSRQPGATAVGLVRSGDTVYVTLLLDPLLTAAEMRSVFVRECPPDSFQIVLPDGTSIGYRTPSGYLR